MARPAGTLDLATALAPYAGTLDTRRAAHLLRRTGFGGSPTEIGTYAALSPEAAARAAMDFSASPGPLAAQLDPMYGRGESKLDLKMARRQNDFALTKAWYDRMLTTPTPLQEKLTLFWHGHFTSALQKQASGNDMLVQNNLFRRFSLGNVRDLTHAIASDPAMLKYLDNANSSRVHPNENFARELMELFTLGIGNYAETDVRESARAFTGWTLSRPHPVGSFMIDPTIHDSGNKTFLGKTGNFDGRDIVDIIFAQRACSRFFSAKLIDFFVYNDPEPEFVDAVAALLEKNRFDVKPVLATLFTSNVFYSDRAYRALVKSPVEYIVGAQRLFGIADMDRDAYAAVTRMGQRVFYPPSVKGWDGGAAWLSSNTLLARENYASALSSNPKLMQAEWMASALRGDPTTLTKHLVDTILQGDASSRSVARVVGYLNGAGVETMSMLSGENIDERVRGAAYLTMATPAFQLN